MDFFDEPAEDDLKPDLPYVAGAVLKIQQIQPHDPFGGFFRDKTSRTRHVGLWLQPYTPSRFCLQNPPLQGRPIANPETRTIIIDSQIAGGDGRGAQVVKCHYEGGHKPLVAKIYDPLYYPWPDMDPTYEADNQFTTEAATFITLQGMDKDHTVGYPRVRQALNGSIPQYYGSYTWETQLLDGQRRDVRLILMEHIPFPSMSSLIKTGRVASIPADVRMRLLARAFELHAWLVYYGVNQNDFAPRNIMVDPDHGRVVLLDFSVARIRDLYNCKWCTLPGQAPPAAPASPIQYWAYQWGDDEIESWVPKDLHPARARYNWFNDQWGYSKIFRVRDADYEPSWQNAIDEEIEIILRERISDGSTSQSDEY